MTEAKDANLDIISSGNITTIGSRGMSWIFSSKQGIPEYIAKREDSFTDYAVAKLLEQTCHPCLPRCFGSTYMIDANVDCFLFEYIDGVSLKQYEFKNTEDMISVFATLFDLLTFMQTMFEYPLLHLDIKPENVIIRDNGQPVLIDFDSACIDARKVRSCTQQYASPEHRGGRPQAASDVYSLSLALTECLLNLPASQIVETPLAEIADMIPKDLAYIGKTIIRCLSADYEARPKPDEVASVLKHLDVEDTFFQIDEEIGKSETSNNASVVCVWQSAEMACELAAEISRHKNKVLLIDVDWLDPRSDLLLGLKKIDRNNIAPVLTSYLDAALKSAEQKDLSQQKMQAYVRETSVPGLYLLMPSGRLEFYEKELSSAFCDLINIARQSFDLVVILAGPLIYDDLTCVSLTLADHVITAVKANTADLRTLGRILTFIRLHQLADTTKFKIAAHDYCRSQELSITSLNELCSNRLIGTVSFHQRRRRAIGSSRPYALSPSRVNRSEYETICRRLSLL